MNKKYKMANNTVTKRDIEQAKKKAEYEKLTTIAYWNKLLRNPFFVIIIIVLYGYTIYSKPIAIWSLPIASALGILKYWIHKKGTG